MNALQVAHRYFDAWNRHDAEAIVATFAEDGTYSDPTAGAGLSGDDIAAYANGQWAAFPNLSFDIVSAADTGAGMVAAQWIMRGTNTGAFQGLPPTGRTVTLPGADFVQVEGGKIRAVQGYFDSRIVPEQLGLQVLVQPRAFGPITFGNSVYLQPGRRTRPGAFSLTALVTRSEEEAQEVAGYSRCILQEMMQLRGFVSALIGRCGNHMFTVTAWETPEDPQQLLQNGTHKEAMKRFFGPDFLIGGVTNVWVPARINTMWVRCAACGRMADAEQLAGQCQCGHPLPEHPPYW